MSTENPSSPKQNGKAKKKKNRKDWNCLKKFTKSDAPLTQFLVPLGPYSQASSTHNSSVYFSSFGPFLTNFWL